MSGLVGMGVVFLLVPLILRQAQRHKLAHRSGDLHHTHKTPVPRLGGIALAAAFLVIEALVFIFFPEQGDAHDRWVILGSSVAMFGLGLWDDLKPLGAKRKLLGQLLIATVVCCLGIGIQTFKIPFTGKIIDLSAWGVLITVLWLVTMTNLINLIDGVDGLASGICLMLMTLLAYVGHQNGNLELVASGMAGALLAFLWFNFPPARIYLGDGGAYFLGFQIGILALVSSQKGTVVAALVAPLFVLALPIVDTALAILRRGLRGLPIFRPDRRHIHHRLLDMGLSRRRVVLSLYGITLIFLVMGYAVILSRGILIPSLLGMAALVLLLCAGNLSFSREWFAVGRILGNSLEMRREVEYALCLTKWLALEGGRHRTIEALWADLQTVVQRLGFSGVKLILEDETRYWERPQEDGVLVSARHELLGGRCGVIELKAVVKESEAEGEVTDESLRRIADPKVFEIMSELVAEGWLKATKGWEQSNSRALRFSSRGAERSEGRKISPLLARLISGRRKVEAQSFNLEGPVNLQGPASKVPPAAEVSAKAVSVS
jgi:UDP-GlcNAc:undecaprenyl-phosphate GlcNAc-1-phosphate transferase